MNNCSLYENTEYNYYADSYVYEWDTTILDAKNNWWGTADPEKISESIYDYHNNNDMAVVDFSSFLDAKDGSPVVSSPVGDTYLIGGTYDDKTLNGTYLVPYYFKVQAHTLSVTPGTTIRFMSGAYLIVSGEGTLTAGDPSGSPVTFTSGAAEPDVGDWKGIRFHHNSGGTLNNCVVEYSDPGIYISNVASPQIAGCNIRYNTVGVKLWYRSRSNIPLPVMNNCSFYENTEYNYYADSYVYDWNT
ncbi:MAG: right-handed parallel beta-helix repeat-containing protein, partial [Gammaproteobacteria bacterium]|nr:right-handed parallel beta-helix repeat-containing protein [Gammaproteobacteria bacterium]